MTVAAIDRCLALLELLAAEPDGVELGVIAERTGMPLTAAHRTAATLVERGYLVQDPASQAYALSLRLAILAFRNLDARHLPDVAQAVLERLAARTGEYCRLSVVEGDGLTWIARAQGATAGLRYEPLMGHEVVLHATATGKAWLATLDENVALQIVCARGLDRGPVLGPKRLKTVDDLRQHLAETRARGYAIAVEEGEPGTVALAVVFRADERAEAPVAGTLSVAGPLVRMEPERYPEIARALHEAAAEMAALWPLRKRQSSRTAPVAGPSLVAQSSKIMRAHS
jgi:IclR family acetate operon transcriptional repressor